MKRVLLTGASGNVGRETFFKLLEGGFDVTVLDLPSKKNKRLLDSYKNRAKIVYGSIEDADLINRLVSYADVVIHLAAVIPPAADKNPSLARRINFGGTSNIVHAIKHYNPSCFLIFASSISVYGDRTKDFWIKASDACNISEGDYYALTKIVSEKLIRESGIKYTVFRLTGIMGLPHTDPLMFHMPLNTKLEIASTRAAGAAFAKACSHTAELCGNTYNLGGGEACRTDYRSFLNRMLDIYGLSFKYFNKSAFAEKNFHCGYLEDSYVLNGILGFQGETLEDYYAYVANHTPKLLRFFTRIFARPIAYFLCKSSEPYTAKKKKLRLEINRYYN